ncbi:MAG: polysulfide reductase NrfD [Sulfurospirillum sp.]
MFALAEKGMKQIEKFIPMRHTDMRELLNFKKTPLNLLVAFTTLVFLVLFVVGATNYLIHGHHAYGVTREHPWGLMIAMYIFFVVSSTGLCIMSAIGHVFEVKVLEPFAKRAIHGALVTLLSGFVVIFLEIGHPLKMMIYNTISPGLTSAIWGMGVLYSLYLIFIVIEFFFLLRLDHKWAKRFGIFGLVVGVAAHSNLGAVFGFLVARPVANGIYYPLYFILSAMVTGCYLIFLMYGFKYKLDFPPEMQKTLIAMGKILGLLLAILLFFEIWRMLTAIYGGMYDRAATAMHILKSSPFLIGEILLGILIPFAVILFSNAKAIKTMVFASFGGMIGIFFMRYDLVHDTQLFPMQTLKIREYQLPPSFIEYTPSMTEIFIALGAIGIAITLYYIGDKILYLETDPD